VDRVPNPIHIAVDAVVADQPDQAAGATCSTSFPSDSSLTHVQVQVAWDGSPNDADNREDAAMRFTVWAPKGRPNLAIDEAEGLRARLLAGGFGAGTHRVDRGAGRLPGTDPDTQLPFCSFSLSVVLNALTP
jgi:hypothetical protein